MKNKNKIKILIITALLMSIVSINVYAYELQPLAMKFSFTGQYNLTLAYQQRGSINHSSAIYTARSAWNNSSAHVWVSNTTPNTGENFVIDSKDFGSTGWHGLCQPPILIVPDTSFISINDYYYESSFKNDAAELVAHEMGHSFRLKDVSNTSVLMRSSGYKKSAQPEQDDVDGVNATYK